MPHDCPPLKPSVGALLFDDFALEEVKQTESAFEKKNEKKNEQQ